LASVSEFSREQCAMEMNQQRGPVLCVGPTPAAQRVMVFPRLHLDQVNRAATTADGVAGKAVNVAKVLKALGCDPVASGFIGGERGRWLQAVLQERGIATDFVTVHAPTRQCITVIDSEAGTHTELVEESLAVGAADYPRLVDVVRRRARECSALVMSGTIPPGGPTDFYGVCTELGRSAGILTILDAQGPALLGALEAGPSVVKPNRTELATTLKAELTDETAVLAAARELRQRGAGRVVVTAGREATLAVEKGSAWRIRSPKLEAVNPIGSGDAFTAGLAWRLLTGADLGEACRWASATGAANALTLMAGEIRREDVERLAGDVEVEKLG
jgi:tagatose 6-phosphate kinase